MKWLRGYLEEKRKTEGSSDDVSSAELEEFYRQTNKCALVSQPNVTEFLFPPSDCNSSYCRTSFFQLSHLMWGLWGLVQARYSTIDFDYLEYEINSSHKFYRVHVHIVYQCGVFF